jgi:methionyl-tRNA synthetase
MPASASASRCDKINAPAGAGGAPTPLAEAAAGRELPAPRFASRHHGAASTAIKATNTAKSAVATNRVKGVMRDGSKVSQGRGRVKTFDISPRPAFVHEFFMKSFYITTAIDYVNGSPHLGHAYEKVLTDVIARFRRQMGDRVHFLTGTDEHGQKVQASARQRGVSPQQFCDEVSQEFRALLPRLQITNDDFIRTTEERHKRVVRRLLADLQAKGDIYQAEYRGFYSTRQEQFLQDKDRNPDGTWPEIFGEVTEITESNYFFRLRQYQGWWVDFLTRNENYIFPRFRQTQVLEFLKEPLNDLCISRPRERLEWGIPLPFDENYVTYVWFDALTNYYSAVVDRPGIWPADYHVIGKDILVPPHAVYWPIMLHAAGVPLPRGIIAHGWWLQRGSKMSKSTGNALNPLDLVDQFGADAFRYFLMREMNVGQDSDFTPEQFLVRYNSELANNLGNLVNRTLNMTTRFAGGVLPAAEVPEEPEREVHELWARTAPECVALCEGFQFHTALERTMAFVTATNAYIEKRAPWKLGKSPDPQDQARLRTALATMAEALRLATALLQHVIPGAAARIREVLGYTPGANWRDELAWDGRLTGRKVAESLVLFPRPKV